MLAAEHVDEARRPRADRRALLEQRRDAHEPQRRLGLVGEPERGRERRAERVEELVRRELRERVVEVPHAALGVEELVQVLIDAGLRHGRPVPRWPRLRKRPAAGKIESAMHPVVRAAPLVALVWALGSMAREPEARLPVVVPPANARGVTGLPAVCWAAVAPPRATRASPSRPRTPTRAARRERRAERACRRSPSPARSTTRRASRSSPDPPERLRRVRAAPLGEPGQARPIEPTQGDAKARASDGIELTAARGAKVSLVAIEGQEGDAEVVFVGDHAGTTVVTAHAVHDGDRMRTVLLAFGRLDHAAPGVAVHTRLPAGSPVGVVGDGGTVGAPRLYLEARELKDGVDLATVDVRRLFDPSVSLPTDPRNVLAVRR